QLGLTQRRLAPRVLLRRHGPAVAAAALRAPGRLVRRPDVRRRTASPPPVARRAPDPGREGGPARPLGERRPPDRGGVLGRADVVLAHADALALHRAGRPGLARGDP